MKPSPVPVFAALADDTRWSILVRLGEGPASASALARELPVTRQAVAQHIEALRGVGLVTSRREGREVVHQAVGSVLTDAARRLEDLGARWDTRLAQFKALAEGD